MAFAAVHRDEPGAGEAGTSGGGFLEFRFERLVREDFGKLFFKPFYRRADFDDERYSPVFSPVARPGQKVRISLRLERWEGQSVGVEGYVRDSFSGKDIGTTAVVFPKEGERRELEFAIPRLDGSCVDEVGLKVTSFSGKGKRDTGRFLIDSFSIGGPASYSIDLAKQTVEFGCVTPFSHDGGTWSIEEGRLQLMTPSPAASYSGGYRVGDQRVRCRVRPLAGLSHLLIARAKGAMRSYLGGFDGEGLALFKKDFGLVRLARVPFAWEKNRDYGLCLEARGDRLLLSIDGKLLLEARDSSLASGMVGCGSLGAARALYGPFEIEEF